MTKWFVALMALLFCDCTSETKYGDCIGLDDDPNPDLVYSVDTGNVIVSVVFFETIFVPLYVALEEFRCPIGRKEVAK